MKLVVGLGNPGLEYAGTRHNVGFEVVELLARRYGIAIAKRDFKSVLGEGMIRGERVLLARPMTFMNLSGEAVAAVARYYKILPEEIILLLDEVALPPGKIRLRLKGSAGGHNGLASILSLLNTQEVPRIRLGVGPARPGDMVGHVLSRFRKEEVPLMQEAYAQAADAVECAIAEGFEMAMNRYNLSEKPPKERRQPESKPVMDAVPPNADSPQEPLPASLPEGRQN